MTSPASYDELMKQVLNLQKENTDLRRELLHSSTHIRQIETDSSAMKDTLVNVRLTLSETDTCAAAAAYDVAMSDTYASRQTPPTVMPTSDLAFVDHNYSLSGGKSCYWCLHLLSTLAKAAIMRSGQFICHSV